MRLCELCLGVCVRVPPAKWKMKANGNSTPVLRIGYHNQRLKGSNDFPFFEFLRCSYLVLLICLFHVGNKIIQWIFTLPTLSVEKRRPKVEVYWGLFLKSTTLLPLNDPLSTMPSPSPLPLP